MCIALLQISLNVIAFDENQNSCEYKESTEGYVVRGMYYWARLVSILINVIIYISITVKINNMVETSKGGKYEALTELAARMKYYPLFQALSRSGAAWDEFNRAGESGYFPSSLMRSICSPSSGIWYFMIFLLMQPGMLDHAKSIVKENVCCCIFSLLSEPDDSFQEFGALTKARDSAVSGSGRVSLTGSMVQSDGHSRAMFKSDEGGLDSSSVDFTSTNIAELDEDDLESLITTGTYTERTLSRRRSVSTGNTRSTN